MIGELFNAMFKGAGTVNINGTEYTGQNIYILHDDVFVDGVLQGSNVPDRNVTVSIIGDVTRVQTHSGDVQVYGNVSQLSTDSGDVHCNDILGYVRTLSGDVSCGDVGLSISTVSGDIIKRK